MQSAASVRAFLPLPGRRHPPGGDVETSHDDGAGGGERLERRQLRHPRRGAGPDHQRKTSEDPPQQNKTVRAPAGVVPSSPA